MVKETKVKESKPVDVKAVELMKISYDLIHLITCGRSAELTELIYKLLSLTDENGKWLFNGKDLIKFINLLFDKAPINSETYVSEAIEIRRKIEQII